jgi:hypothetical protein
MSLPFTDEVVAHVLVNAINIRVPPKDPKGDFGPFEIARTVEAMRAPETDQERRATEWLAAQCQALLALLPPRA